MADDVRKFPGYDEPDPLEEEEVVAKKSFVDKLREKRDAYSEKANFYATVFFSLVAIGAFFAFLFLVPFVIEPAVTTLQKDFDVNPVTCCVVSKTDYLGASNCSDWVSCREGCTIEVYNCTKIIVAYTDAENFSCADAPADYQWMHDSAFLYPNVKGCGYPPALNCTVFNAVYGDPSRPFPCYYSREDATMVITELDPDRMEAHLALAIVVPVLCFALSVAFLVHAYRRMKRREAAAQAASALAAEEERAARLLEEAEAEAEAEAATSRSNPNSSYSLKSITSKINSTVVRFARDRGRQDSGSGDEIEMDEVVERRPPSRYLQPGRLPSGGHRRQLLPPLEPAAADSAATTSADSTISPVET